LIAPGRDVAELVYRDESSEVWLGSALNPEHVATVMGARKADLVCIDAPYSEKTHAGHDRGKHTADSMAKFAKKHSGKPSRESNYAARKSTLGEGRRELNYPAWSPDDVDKSCEIWVPRSRGWHVSITDDVLARAWLSAYETEGLYPFAPLPLVETGSRCRMAGDGPSAWTCWIVVARPRTPEFRTWGTMPGAYVVPGERDFNRADSGRDPARVVGGKPLRAMLAIVSDYSKRGDLVVDYTCGGGTTGAAAKQQGRRFIGMDVDPKHAELTAKRLAATRVQEVLSFGLTGVEQRGLWETVT
jgi:hypothetical protein